MSFLKEPFVHFAAIGIAIFAWFAFANPDSVPDPEPESDAKRIVVGRPVVEAIAAQFEAKLSRAPTAGEVQALVGRHVQEEVLVREARALGLDQGDGIIRNRLVQKMGFLTTSQAQAMIPDDATLQAHLEENADRFTKSAQIAFAQYGLPRGADSAMVTAALEALQRGEVPAVMRQQQLLPPDFALSTQQHVDGVFGTGFFAQVQALPVGEWAGPVTSGYGPHLVRVSAYQPGELPRLDDIRDDVLADWRRGLGTEITEAYVKSLLEIYEVEQPSEDDIANWMTQ